MWSSVSNSVARWASSVSYLMRERYLHLSPDDYCIGAVFVIAIGYVLLLRR